MCALGNVRSATIPSKILVMKLRVGKRTRIVLDELRELIGGAKNVRILTANLSNEEIAALHHAADVYISLHRSEGFGLNIYELLLARESRSSPPTGRQTPNTGRVLLRICRSSTNSSATRIGWRTMRRGIFAGPPPTSTTLRVCWRRLRAAPDTSLEGHATRRVKGVWSAPPRDHTLAPSAASARRATKRLAGLFHGFAMRRKTLAGNTLPSTKIRR